MDKFLKKFFYSGVSIMGKYLKYVFWCTLGIFVVDKLDWLFKYIDYMDFFDFIWFIVKLVFGLIFIRLGYEITIAIFDIHKEITKKPKK